MLAFCVLAPMGDAFAKLLGERFGVAQLVLVRFLFQAVVLAPIVWTTGRSIIPHRRVLKLAVVRTVLHIAGIGLMFSALRFLPLADAVAIAFVMPFIMLFLGRFILNELVGPRRIIASIVGFFGTLLVVQPSFVEVGLPALLPLGVALVFALFMLVTRQIAKEIDPLVLQAASGAIASALLIPVVLVLGLAAIAGQGLVLPDGPDWILLGMLGTLGTVAHLVMTWSLRFAPSATLAPMQYLEIPFAALIGWLVFADFPNGLSLIGILITMAAGVNVLLREQAVSRQSQRQLVRDTPAEAPAECPGHQIQAAPGR